MAEALGKCYKDGDLRIKVVGKTWTFNPLCVIKAEAEQGQLDNDDAALRFESQLELEDFVRLCAQGRHEEVAAAPRPTGQLKAGATGSAGGGQARTPRRGDSPGHQVPRPDRAPVQWRQDGPPGCSRIREKSIFYPIAIRRKRFQRCSDFYSSTSISKLKASSLSI